MAGADTPIPVDVVVLGAGAAGLMAAATAARRGRRVAVLDHAPEPGRKIRISGGGRCNFTHLEAGPGHYLSNNPRFCISALKRYTPWDMVSLVSAHGIGWTEKAEGQLFTDGPAEAVVTALCTEVRDAGAALHPATPVTGVVAEGGAWAVHTERGIWHAESLVVATGGRSAPKLGATGFGHALADRFGIPVVPPRPALVPLVLDDGERATTAGLSGVALPARVACGRVAYTDDLLFTHRGLSGPAVLQISSHWTPEMPVTIDLAPGTSVFEHLRAARADRPRQALRTVLADVVPQRVARWLAARSGSDESLGRLSNRTLQRVADLVHRWQVVPAGTEGWRTAEVTAGGVDTHALSSQTFACHAVPGLYFVGEVLDVTGELGGFNLQWAWSSGYAAGEYI